MEAYSHILCATDFSLNSERAVERAIDISKQHNAKITWKNLLQQNSEWSGKL